MYGKILELKDWVVRYERHLSALALLGGFITDTLTLRRIDQLYGNLVLMGYFCIVMIGILVLNILEARKNKRLIAERIVQIAPLAIQFAFGGLFSGFTIFYFRSGSLAASWPFIIILVGLLLGNELLRRQYERLAFQITVLFISVFFFAIFFVPVIVDTMGPLVFLISGASALLFITLFVYLLYLFVPTRIYQTRKYIGFAIGSAFLIINLLYFTNLIPPIPLSLKSAGIYQKLEATPTGYVGWEEKRSYFSKLQFFDNMHIVRGSSLYAYSSVFAPTNIRAEVVHNWQRFDPKINRWVSVTRIPYAIAGGNDRGYRGYSLKTNLSEGAWRVDVETSRGQVIGRILFDVIYSDAVPQLERKQL